MNISTIKSIAALALTGTASVLVLGFRTSASPADATTSTAIDGAAGSSSSSAASSSSRGAQSGTAATPSTGTPGVAAGATYADGTWAGAAVREPWGTFEIEAVVTNGRITNVNLVSSPNDGHSSRINRRAVPTLTASAIATQSANVDMVSGATWTSQSYATSLQAALDDAKAAAQAAA
jgi:uncharacterized protein with FMN-binding domain